jgi:DNA primase
MLSSEQRESMEVAAARYMDSVEPALPYLLTRGIDRATASSRGLGYVADPIPGHKPALGRLAIPYITNSGVVAMSFRCIKEHSCKEEKHPKYWKPKSQSAVLYGVQDAFTDSLDIHIAEGEMDAITLSALCALPSLGVTGAQYWKPWWTLILKDFRRVFVYADGDEAGRHLCERLQKEVGMSVIPVLLPDGEDVNSLYLKHGAEYLRSMAK